MDRLAELLAVNNTAGRPWRLRDLARSFSDEPGRNRVWAAVVADSLDDLATKLPRAREGAAADGVFTAAQDAENKNQGQVAFLFPGQGSQRPGMLADLFVAFPRLRRFLQLGKRWAEAMFPPAAFGKEEAARQRAVLTDTRVAQPTLGIAGLAMHELLTLLGVEPDHLGGHSYGELVALSAAGAVGPEELLRLSYARGQAILAAAGSDPGTMAAVAANAEQVEAVLGDGPVVVANHNAPGQAVISGPIPAVEAALSRLRDAGLTGSRIPVACAFHSPVVAGAMRTFATELDRHTVTPPRLPVWSNTTAAPYPSEPAAIRATLAAHIAEPVRFVKQVEAMYAAGVRIFVEVGPGRVLTKLVDEILTDRPHTCVPTDIPGEPGLRRFLLALAQLAVAGVPVDLAGLFHGRDARALPASVSTPISESITPRRAGWMVNGHLVKTADGQYLRGGLRPAKKVAAPTCVTDSNAGNANGRETAVLEFLRSTRELVAAQREIMLGYLGITPASAGMPTPSLPPAAMSLSTAAQLTPVQDAAINTTIDVGSPERVEPAELTPDAVLATVRTLVSDRTGYPVDMLGADLDLEADLSIDSIKRTELVGLLADRLGLTRTGGPLDDSVAEELSRLRTLRSIVDWIVNRPWGQSPANSIPAAPVQASRPPRARRYLVEAISSPVPAGPPAVSVAGRRVTVVGDGGGIALDLSVLLEQHGAEVRLLGLDQVADQTRTDAFIYLAALDRGRAAILPDGFIALRDAIRGGVSQLLVVTGSGGRFARTDNPNGVAGVGLAGLVRTIAREFPDRFVRVVDVDPKEEPAHLAGQLLTELVTPGAPTAVGYTAGERVTLQVVPAPLECTSPAVAGIGPESVVLLTGGARGITGQVAVGLARATGCHLELVGRTPLPRGEEEPVIAAATDRVALRRVLAQSGGGTPAQIEATASRLLAEREIRTTLGELNGLAASVHYSAVDVRDPASVTALVNDVYQRHGRLDGIVHGAGVLADRLLVDKTVEDFTQVWETKVNAARALVDAARNDLKFLVLFGSVSGVFGNRGQADYSAANDALDTLARIWTPRACGRVVAVDWGPWAASENGIGMVSAELEREYTRRGIGLIQPDDGVACLLAELAGGTEPQVMYMCANPAAFEAGAFEVDQDG
jgi:malonyl CoA-acyl carrier protein transacylase/NAD(P)-dependent dehydrogenase (short-subunit alcohol dehydrogenase family)